MSRQVDPNYFATLEDLMAAASVSERTIRNWLERGLVPTPVKVSLGYPNGVFNRYPAYACEQVRFHRRDARRGALTRRDPGPRRRPGLVGR
jgi:hypothetical protein